MKKLFIISLALMLAFTLSDQLTAQSTVESYRLLHVKFKPGKAKEGMDIGKKYFSRAYAEAGHPAQVIEFHDPDGDWDGLILLPLSAGLPEEGQPHPTAVMEKLIRVTGGMEALRKIDDQFNSMVERMAVKQVQVTGF